MPIQKVKVNIFGSTYTIQGEAPPEYIVKLAKFVDRKMDEVSNTLSSANLVQISILAALNIADEYYQLKDIEDKQGNDIAKRANALISMLEEGLIGDVFPKR